MDAQEFFEVLRARRSVRKFVDEPVPDADIEQIVTAASWAPSGTNHQNWYFIVIRSREMKDRMHAAVTAEVEDISARITMANAQRGLTTYMNYFTFFYKAPVVIAVVKKPHSSVIEKVLERYDLGDRFKTSTDVQGPSAAVQNLALMAHVLGYGTCWMTGPLIARKKLEDILQIGGPDELMALIPIGKPAHEAPPTAPGRKKIQEIIRYV